MNDFLSNFRSRLLGDRKLTQLTIIAVVIFTIFSVAAPDIFFTSSNFTSMAYQIPEIAILSMAVMLSMLTGGIDLSIVAVSNVAALITAYLLQNHVYPKGENPYIWIVIACIAGVVAGLLCGAVNALLIARLEVTPILATLATLTLFNGIAIGATGGKSISGLPEEFLRLGNGTLFKIPTPFVVMIIVAILMAIFVNKSGIGLKTFMIGTNRTAAKYSVMGDRRIIAITYLVSALLSSVAGLVIASRSSAASPDFGSSYILLAIVIVVLGGVNPSGGFGTITGVVLATAVLQFVSSGFNALRFSQFFYLISQGSVLIAVMVLNVVVERRSIARARAKSMDQS